MKRILIITILAITFIACKKSDYSPNSNKLVVNFSTNDTIIPYLGTRVTFSNSSSNFSSCSWSFPGGTPDHSNQANPIVIYDSNGNFSVTLTATDKTGVSQTKTRQNYIKVGSGISGSWVQTSLPTNIRIINWMYLNGNDLYVGNRDKTFITSDLGNTWREIQHGSCSFFISNNTMIALTSSTFTIDISNDNGSKWSSVYVFPSFISFPGSPDDAMSSITKVGSTLIACFSRLNGISSDVAYSLDNGNNWTSVPDLTGSQPFYLYTFNNMAFITSWKGIYKSSNGISWTRCSNLMENTYAYSLTYCNSKLYAVDPWRNLFYSTDNGSNWIKDKDGADNILTTWNNWLISAGHNNGVLGLNNGTLYNITDNLQNISSREIECVVAMKKYLFVGTSELFPSSKPCLFKRDLSNFPSN